ncbi:hypothetical protein BK712_17355 [Bacillus thuringiensis serovar seoulensis]|nr:hypothetical protein BK712_17355 [Bacillus thuringiensis serovar seoulensis]
MLNFCVKLNFATESFFSASYKKDRKEWKHEYYRLRINKEKKINDKKKMVTIPIVKLVITTRGEIQFEVIGEKEVPIAWIEKE